MEDKLTHLPAYQPDPPLAISTLPDWLSPHPPDDPLPRFPTTPDQRKVQNMVFESIFESVLDMLIEGKPVKTFVQSDPRQISYGRFMQWVKADPVRVQRYEEAQQVGTEVLAEEMKEISDGDGLEDVQRSTLRVNTRKWLMQSWNRRRYGAEKETTQPFGMGGITVVIGDVKTDQITSGVTIEHDDCDQ